MAQLAERHEALTAAFDSMPRDAASGREGLAAARSAAFDRFLSRGFPSTRDEEWRFTNVAPIAAQSWVRGADAPVDPAALAAVVPTGRAALIVLVNGRVVTLPGTLPTGVTVRTVKDARSEELVPSRPAGATIFTDLNLALFEDLVVVEIAPKAIVVDPIVIASMTTAGSRPQVVSPRLVVTAGEASQVSLIEIHADAGSGEPIFVNAVMDVRVGPSALVDHVKLQCQATTSFHLASMFVRAERAATFTSHAVTVGGRIARNDIVSVLDGEGAECTLNGLYVAGGDSLVDTHTTIDHAQPHCPSHEVYKGILTGRARAVFNGKIVVRQDAQKTDAKQTNKALLLTDDAQINTKPQLEIFADDVKCTHGAAIGQLDEDALFYLKARGISAIDARNMLIHAFAGDVLGGIRSDALRHAAMARVEAILGLPAE
jgi:Fe-S cluster assembly protein SufD